MTERRTMRKVPELRVPPVSGFASGGYEVAAVDAAKQEPAFVFGYCGRIEAAGFDTTPGRDSPLKNGVHDQNIDHVVLELSRSYGSRDAGKHGDIIAETCGGALTAGAMRAGRMTLVHPDEWAGQTQKPPRHQRIWEVLAPGERKIIAAAAGVQPRDVDIHIELACDAIALGKKPKYSHKVHNLLDAAGLFLFAVGRIKKGGGRV